MKKWASIFFIGGVCKIRFQRVRKNERKEKYKRERERERKHQKA